MVHDRGMVSKGASKGSYQREAHLERFGGVENVCEFRRGRWRYSGDIGVGNVVIAAIRQIQKIGRNASLPIKFISEPHIEQQRRRGAIDSVGRQIARAKVAQAHSRREAFVIVQCDAR